MARLTDIRAALATNLATLKDEGLNAYAYERGGNIAVPAATVMTPNIPQYRRGGTNRPNGVVDNFSIDILLRVKAQQIDEAAIQMSEWADWGGTKSIPTAIESDRIIGTSALGGLVDDCICDSFRPFTIDEFASVNFWGGFFTVRILPRST